MQTYHWIIHFFSACRIRDGRPQTTRKEIEMMRTFFKSKRFAALALLCGVLLTCSAGRLAAQAPATPSPVPAATPSPTPSKSTLTVHITGIRNAKGKVNIALFWDAKGFPSEIDSAVSTQRLEIDPQTLSVTAVFANLPQGTYAVSLLHDEKLIGRMEFDSQGIPQNGFGLSNNPDTSQGPPTAEQARFQVNQPAVAIEIKMVYWQ
jgi:uncharacterized protein (DUF2141 family)